MQDSDKRGPGQFQWNRGGWFGGQIGATLWLVLLGGLLLAQGRLVGAVALVLGLLSNVLGVLLWHRRQTLSPYPALQVLLGVSGISAAISLAAISMVGSSPQTFQISQTFWALLSFPAVMVMFHLQERAARKTNA
jgi:hypothetical protein